MSLAYRHNRVRLTVGKVKLQEMVKSVNKMRRSFLFPLQSWITEAETSSQVTTCSKLSGSGFPLRIRR